MPSFSPVVLSSLIFFLLLSSFLVTAIPTVELTQPQPGSFSISVNGQTWFTSGSLFFNAHSTLYTPEDSSLTPTTSTADTPGFDSLGTYSLTSTTWTSSTNNLQVETSIKAYSSLASQSLPLRPTVRALVFTQKYLTAVTGCNTTRDSVVSGYPTLKLPTTSEVMLGYYQFSGVFLWSTRRGAPWSSEANLVGGLETGPYVVHNASAGTMAIVAPFDAFMDSSMAVTMGYGRGGDKQVSYGGMGNLQAIPEGWSMSTIIYFDDVGVTEGVMRWGDAMCRVYGKSRETSANDLINSWLGYNTDRGATYYVYNKAGDTYETTMYGVKAYADSLNIPYKYWLTDSRWYQQGTDGGMITWDPKAEDFSAGFRPVTLNTHWKLVAHTRYYSAHTAYAKQNGGAYNFIIDKSAALPLDLTFWNDLFLNRSDWGLTTLFQDWLSTHYEVGTGIDALTQQVGLGEMWLTQMATAAAAADVTIQYCMPLFRHLMAALRLRAVTQIRVSDDGMPDDSTNQWQIGESAILAYSLGVMPFKDNFWTTPAQCDNPYYGKICVEPNTVLESAVATFSAGAVAPGDGIGQSNASLIFRSINSEGRLLKPSRPMGSLDLWYAANAFTRGGVQYTLWSTYSQIATLRWHYILAVNNPALTVTGADLHLELDPMPSQRYYQWRSMQGVDDYTTLAPFTTNTMLPATKLPTFTITHLAPVLAPSPIVILGEKDKWVRMSPQRVSYLSVSGSVVSVSLIGAGGEMVVVDYVVERQGGGVGGVMSASCVLGQDGMAVLVIKADGTASCGLNMGREGKGGGRVVEME